MSMISVEKPTPETLRRLNVESWGIWECEISRFDWEYDETETCYILEGQVRVTTAAGETVEFGPGDLVVFPRGLKCTWDVSRPVRKHFQFS
ncbi:MAG: cupin domain-containing protein [Myxococcales bacterium]|nr:cupin domain-containing protein [Myxococcales bacterium]